VLTAMPPVDDIIDLSAGRAGLREVDSGSDYREEMWRPD